MDDRLPARAPVCLVTGAAIGIGAACAREFARRGFDVVVAHLPGQEDDAQDVADDCAAAGASTLTVVLDVREDAQCREAVRVTLQRFSQLDVLVNSAGTTRFVPHADLDALADDEFLRTYDVNTVGIHRMVRAAAPALKASEAGAVVNISSVGGVLGRGSSMAYAASKGAVNTLTLALARALAPQVRVNAIAPGFVDGGLPSRVLDAGEHARVRELQTRAAPLARVSAPEEVAQLAWFVAARLPGMTGEVLVMDNGLHLNAG
jgi:NAD(P)-dependent dehydrogenase (short-subunit alcohol dehydrogenase family)